MIIVRLIREEYTDKQVTGKLYVYDSDKITFTCFTLELPDLGNQRRISCIPEGSYECELVQPTPKFKYLHYDVKKVPMRDGIKIHAGNFHSEILGCLLPGNQLVDINKDGYKDVVNSKATLKELIKHAGNKFTLTISKSKYISQEIKEIHNE